MGFKVGELVRCVDASGRDDLVEDNYYRVDRFNADGDMFWVDGVDGCCAVSRFDAVPEAAIPLTTATSPVGVQEDIDVIDGLLRELREELETRIGDFDQSAEAYALRADLADILGDLAALSEDIVDREAA